MNIASLLPAKVRRIIYTVLGAVTAVEAVWDVVPDVLEGKVLTTLTTLGFGLAVANVAKER